jgi:hypothetical protein
MTWRSLGDSNPCFRRERATSWAARRRERARGVQIASIPIARKATLFQPRPRRSGAPRSGEPGIYNHRPWDMDSGQPRFARLPE